MKKAKGDLEEKEGEPREERIGAGGKTFISRFKVRNFKSFKSVDIPLPNGFICLTGPNGSGKSNFIDGVRFALGETSLKAIRSKKVNDLISSGARVAMIQLMINSNGREMEIKRAIRDDGKTLYRLNGKRMTRMAVMDSLKPLGMEVSSHNVIAQGEVERIIHMSPRERREIIDSVAGISDFEDKKKEALRELAVVEAKINDASIVLKEREGYLGELEREKEEALKYNELKGEQKKLKASVLHMELVKVEKDFSRAAEKHVELGKQSSALQEEAGKLGAHVGKLSNEKEQVISQINDVGARNKAHGEMQELKAGIGFGEESLALKKTESDRIGKKAEALQAEKAALSKKAGEWSVETRKFASELASLKAEGAKLESELETASKSFKEKEGEGAKLRTSAEKISSEIEREKDVLREAEFEVAKSRELLASKSRESERLKAESPSQGGKAGELGEQIKDLQEQQKDLTKELDALFGKERDLNKKGVEVDREVLKSKEEWAALKVSVGKSIVNAGLDLVKELKDNRVVPGILGTVEELCSFAPEYATAVEAAAGSRLNNVVVETIDDAAEAIKHLKQKKAGRCTFVPLQKSIRATDAETAKISKSPHALGLLIDFVKFDARLLPAMNYAFGDTILVRDIEAAKKIGVGKARMVTLEGDLIELSSVLTGGFFRSRMNLKEKKQLEKVEEELEQLKAEQKGVMDSLYELREKMTVKRRERSELEVKMKGLEIELKGMSDKSEADKKRAQAIQELEKESRKLNEKIIEKEGVFKEVKGLLSKLEAERAKIKGVLEKIIVGEDEKRVSELREKVSELKNSIQEREMKLGGKTTEIGVFETRLAGLNSELQGLLAEKAGLEGETKRLDAHLKEARKKMVEKEEELRSVSGKMEKLFARRDTINKEIEVVSVEKGRIDAQLAKIREDAIRVETQKSVLEQRLVDFKAEYAAFEGVEVAEGKKADMEARLVEVDREVEGLGMVNLRAPELYEEKKRDLAEVKEKVEKLAEEKTAVNNMIEEIETKKTAIFHETFSKVNENFKRLFNYIFVGEGNLVLQDPYNVFNSGLMIKVKIDAKERFIEAMSGGEKSLLALLFVFSIHMHHPAPFYILDEAEAALDKLNSKRLADLLKQLSKDAQFIVVSHNDVLISNADVAFGVTRTDEGSRVVGINLT